MIAGHHCRGASCIPFAPPSGTVDMDAVLTTWPWKMSTNGKQNIATFSNPRERDIFTNDFKLTSLAMEEKCTRTCITCAVSFVAWDKNGGSGQFLRRLPAAQLPESARRRIGLHGYTVLQLNWQARSRIPIRPSGSPSTKSLCHHRSLQRVCSPAKLHDTRQTTSGNLPGCA